MNEINLIEKKQELSAKLEEKLTKERQVLELEASLRKIDSKIEMMRRYGVSDDNEDLVAALQRRQEIDNLKIEVIQEVMTLEDSIKTLKREIIQILSPQEAGFISEEPSPILEAIFPVVMFPVRLETRYILINEDLELRVRVYPDDISIQTHEPSISEDEYNSGCRYIKRIWWAGKNPCPNDTPEEERSVLEEEWNDRWNSAWLEIANEYGSERAAYIVHLFRPRRIIDFDDYSGKIASNLNDMPPYIVPLDKNGNPEEEDQNTPIIESLENLQSLGLKVRPESWSEPPRSFVMPDFFIIRLYREGKRVFQKMGNPIPTPLHVGPAPISTTNRDQPQDLLFFDAESKWVVDYDEAVEKGMGITITNAEVREYTTANEDIDDFNIGDGFEYVIAIGVKASVDPQEGKRNIESLIESHRFTEGFSIIKQGTPTNNVVNSESGYSRSTDPIAYYTREFGPSLLNGEDSSTMNGSRLAKAFGIDQMVFQYIENANATEDYNARCMIEALWPATMGYYLETMLGRMVHWNWGTNLGDGKGFVEHFSEIEYSDGGRFEFPDIVNYIKQFYLDYIRGRGPLTAIRVGDNPYGILPATSLKTWNSSIIDFLSIDGKTEPREIFLLSMILKILDKLIPLWRVMAGETENVSRAGGIYDPDNELLTLLGMGPSSRDAVIRPFVTIIFLWALFCFGRKMHWAGISEWMVGFLEALGMPVNEDWLNDFENEYKKKWEYYREKFRAMNAEDPNFPDLNPLILNLVAWGKGYELWNLRRTVGIPQTGEDEEEAEESPLIPFVQSAPVTEEPPNDNEESETQEYINFLITETKENIKENTEIDSDSLLYNLLRVSRLKFPVETLSDINNEEDLVLLNAVHFKNALEHLKDLPSAELERLLGETLDLFTNRLDAVITSIASRRLHHMRQIAPEGVHIGAYGWVENLQRNDQEQANEGGFIIAPSHDQAAAGAVLRNAFLSHTAEENKPTFAIRLTSDRVRRAMWLIDGIRQGQPLSALLGYRFEKSLFENYPNFIRSFGSCIYEFRKLYPLEVLQEEHKKGVDTETKEVVIPRNVVDGLKLIKAWQRTKNNQSDPIPFNSNDVLSNLITEEKDAIASELDCIEDAFDSINDLALYENIYHNVRGNFERAPVLLDSLAGSGGVFPEPESILTPRKGFTFKHRVAIIISINDQQLENPWPAVNSPRTLAAPHLSNWIGTILGSPENIKCKYEHEDGSSFITLAELASDQDLGPLDFLSMSTVDIGGGATELEQRILHNIIHSADLTYDAKIRLDFRPDENWDAQSKSFLEIIPFARSLQKLISDSRVLEPADFIHPESVDGDLSSIYTKDELDFQLAHVLSVINKLNEAIEALQQDPITVDQLQDSLRLASLFGVKGSIPLSGSEDHLKVQAANVMNELLKRKTAAVELHTKAKDLKNEYYPEENDSADLNGANANKDPAKVRQSMRKLAECLNTIFETTFKTLPSFTIRNKDELKKTFDIMSRSDFGRPAIKWLQKAAHTHQKLKQYEDAMILSESFTGFSRLDLEVGQLPHPENNHWLGLPLGGVNLDEMQQGSLSLVVSSFIGKPMIDDLLSDDNDIEITGLIIEEWNETIPSTIVNAAIAYNYNRPNTEAPQCVLLAIPPVFNRMYTDRRDLKIANINHPTTSNSSIANGAPSDPSSEVIENYGWWYVEYLAKIVEETIDLAKMRAVDIDAMRVPDDIDELLDSIDNTPFGGPFRMPKSVRTVNFDETRGFGHFLPALYIPTSIDEEEADDV